MDAPKCPFCRTRHWSRQPCPQHMAEVRTVMKRRRNALRELAGTTSCPQCATLEARISELMLEMAKLTEQVNKPVNKPVINFSPEEAVERRRGYMKKYMAKRRLNQAYKKTKGGLDRNPPILGTQDPE